MTYRNDTGAAGRRLANFLKAKARKERQDNLALNEKASWAGAKLTKSNSKSQKKASLPVAQSKKEMFPSLHGYNGTVEQMKQDMLARSRYIKESPVSTKKGTKRKVSASDVQR